MFVLYVKEDTTEGQLFWKSLSKKGVPRGLGYPPFLGPKEKGTSNLFLSSELEKSGLLQWTGKVLR